MWVLNESIQFWLFFAAVRRPEMRPFRFGKAAGIPAGLHVGCNVFDFWHAYYGSGHGQGQRVVQQFFRDASLSRASCAKHFHRDHAMCLRLATGSATVSKLVAISRIGIMPPVPFFIPVRAPFSAIWVHRNRAARERCEALWIEVTGDADEPHQLLVAHLENLFEHAPFRLDACRSSSLVSA